MRLKAVIATVLVLLQPMLALADDPPADVAIIRRAGAPTPFTGVLYSDGAYARMKADQEQQADRAEAKQRYDIGLLEARFRYATSTAAIALDAEKRKDAKVSQIQDERIAKLEADLVRAEEKSHSTLGENLLWMLGGAAAVAVGGLVVAAVAGAFNHPPVVIQSN